MNKNKTGNLLDPFSQKRLIEEVRKSHFSNNAIYMELANEFGRRVGGAVREGLSPEVAFESCREHFKITGQAMIDLAGAISFEMVELEDPRTR